MAETPRNRSSGSRLQRRKPAALQISPPSSSAWNAAIPLLSPLVSSPPDERIPILKSENENSRRNQVIEPEKAVAFKKWQHPAAPFGYEPAKFGPSFSVPV